MIKIHATGSYYARGLKRRVVVYLSTLYVTFESAGKHLVFALHD